MRTRLAALLVTAAVLAAHPVAARQISDARLAERVSESILRYEQFGIFDDIGIHVDNRVVTLTGRVTMPYKRDEIAKRVKKIHGIPEFIKHVEMLPVSRYDSDLRDRLARAIYGHPAFRNYASLVNPPIHIVVENARVTLTGFVNSEVDRMLAYSLAQIPGVLSVTNQLKADR